MSFEINGVQAAVSEAKPVEYESKQEPVKSENSIHEQTATLGNSDKASYTYIVGGGLKNEELDSKYNEINVSSVEPQDGRTKTGQILLDEYGIDTNEPNQEGKNDALWTLFDNNRDVYIDGVNQQYLMNQMVDDIGVQNITDENIQEVSAFIQDPNEYMEEHDAPPAGAEKALEKYNNGEYKQYDKNVRAEDVPPEFIENAYIPDLNDDYSDVVIVAPDLNMLKDDKTDVIKYNTTSSIKYVPQKDKETLELTGSESIEDLAKLIDKAYVVDNQGDPVKILDENSKATKEGTPIVDAICKDPANNEIFDGINLEELSTKEKLQMILDAAKSKGGLELAVPEVAISITAPVEISNEAGVKYLNQPITDETISQLDVTTDSINLDDLKAKLGRDVKGSDILDSLLGYNNKTLADALKNAKAGAQKDERTEIAKTGVTQQNENNPELLKAYPQLGNINNALDANISYAASLAGTDKYALEPMNFLLDKNGKIPETKVASDTYYQDSTPKSYVPDSRPAPRPAPTAAPAPEPDPTAAPAPEPAPTAAPAPEPDPTAAPAPEPDPTAAPAPEPDPTPAQTEKPTEAPCETIEPQIRPNWTNPPAAAATPAPNDDCYSTNTGRLKATSAPVSPNPSSYKNNNEAVVLPVKPVVESQPAVREEKTEHTQTVEYTQHVEYTPPASNVVENCDGPDLTYYNTEEIYGDEELDMSGKLPLDKLKIKKTTNG